GADPLHNSALRRHRAATCGHRDRPPSDRASARLLRTRAVQGAGTTGNERGPLAHPPEPTCPCCLPALGEFSEMTPHEGSAEESTCPAAVLATSPPARRSGSAGRCVSPKARHAACALDSGPVG